MFWFRSGFRIYCAFLRECHCFLEEIELKIKCEGLVWRSLYAKYKDNEAYLAKTRRFEKIFSKNLEYYLVLCLTFYFLFFSIPIYQSLEKADNLDQAKIQRNIFSKTTNDCGTYNIKK